MSHHAWRPLAAIESALSHRLAVAVVAVATGVVFGWLWGSLNPLPWVYDEAAYLLQAKIFASGRWAAAGRPVPEFFEQVHVFVTPNLVPKYPPGHALLLVPGVWLGAPALVPLLFSAATGALVFWWARRLANPWVGLLAWITWVTAPDELFIRPSYLSQSSSTLLWLLGWSALAWWRTSGRTAGLVAFAGAAAMAGITRPVTAVAFLIPTGFWILRELVQTQRWRQVVPALALSLPILALAPVWSSATTGRAFPTPYSEYSRVYQPWDMPGFTASTAAPVRPPTPALERLRREQFPAYQSHTVDRLPAILLARLQGIAGKFWGYRGLWEPTGLRWLLLVLAGIGLLGLPAPVWFLIANAVSLVLIYLWMPASPVWTVYYREVFPLLGLITAIGAWRVATWLGGVIARRRDGWRAVDLAAVLVVLGLFVAVPGIADRIAMAKQWQFQLRVGANNLRRVADAIPGRGVIFVSAGPPNEPYESLVWNEPDLDATRVWIVHDRGEDNARLLRLSPDRKPYLFDPGNPRRVALWKPGRPPTTSSPTAMPQ